MECKKSRKVYVNEPEFKSLYPNLLFDYDGNIRDEVLKDKGLILPIERKRKELSLMMDTIKDFIESDE